MSSVLSSTNDTQLGDIRLYLLKVRNAEVTNTTPTFASTVVGQTTTATFTVTVQNYRGNTATKFTGPINYSFSTSGTDFSIVSAPAGSCGVTATTSPNVCNVSVTLRFSPSAAGTRFGTLTVGLKSTDATDPAPIDPAPKNVSIPLSATGIAAVPGFAISPASRSFSAKVSETGTQTFTISNPASATANLILNAVNGLVFSSPRYTRQAGCANGTSIAPGGNCLLTVAFAPTAVGAANGTLTVNHNATGSPSSVTLLGTGTLPAIGASVAALNFGSAQLGVPRPLPSVTITNTGDAALVFTVNPGEAGTISDANAVDFSFASTCSTALPLAPGGTCTVTGSFKPSALGARSATLTISSDAANGALAIPLSGTGVALPEPTAAFPASAFDDTAAGFSAVATRTVTLANTRSRDINYTVTSSNAADFAIVGGTCAGTLGTVQGVTSAGAGGGSCTLIYRFQPAGGVAGTRNTNLTVSFTGIGGDANPGPLTGTLSGQALMPLTLSATTLSPSAVLSTATTASMLLTNRTPAPLTLTSLPITGTAAADFSVDTSSVCRAGTPIAAGLSCTLTLRFAPTAEGERKASLGLVHGAFGSPQTVALQGTGLPVPQGEAGLSALTVGFADQQLGSTSAPMAVSITNTGTAALTLSALTLGGSHPADFGRAGSCAVGTPLAIGARCEVHLQFSPAALGARSATLRVVSDARSNGDVTVPLAGTGIPVPVPLVELPLSPLDFGAQAVGGLYPPRSVQLKNAGTAELIIAGITVQGAGFSLASGSTCGATLAPAATCVIPVAFNAAAAGAIYSGAVVVASNAAGSPHSAALRATGALAAAPVLSWSPAVAQLSFGEVAVGSASAPQSVTLVNQGPGGVTLTVLNAVGLERANFGFVSGASACEVGTTLFEGERCQLYTVFAPVQAGAKQASLQLAAGASLPPPLLIGGTGIGGPVAALTASVDSLSFGSLSAGSRSAPLTVVITSSGGSALRLTALQVTGPFAVSGGSCPALPFDLPARSTCSVELVYSPQADGAATGELVIGADGDPTQRRLPLSGTATKAPVLSGGGCAIVNEPRLVDPTLWLLAVLAALALWRREVARRQRK